jgi:hypothetical protein
MTDTSREAVKMLAEQHDGSDPINADGLRDWHRNTAATLRALVDERDAAIAARDEAIRMMGGASRQAGSWQGISEGKDLVIKQLEAERDYWIQNSTTAWDTCEQRRLQAAQASLERDALDAERDRLLEALETVLSWAEPVAGDNRDKEAAANEEASIALARAAIAKATGGDQ